MALHYGLGIWLILLAILSATRAYKAAGLKGVARGLLIMGLMGGLMHLGQFLALLVVNIAGWVIYMRCAFRTAARWMLPALVLWATDQSLLAFFPDVADAPREPVMAGCMMLLSAMVWADLIQWPRREARAGVRVVDLGAFNRPKAILSVLMFAALAILLIFCARREFAVQELSTEHPFHPFSYLATAFFAGSCAVAALAECFSRLEIREHGILYFNDFIPWQQMSACAWDEECDEVLVAQVCRRIAFSRPINAPLILYVPSPHRSAIEPLLARCNPGMAAA